MKLRDFPVHLEIESTNRCNLACTMCPHKDMKRKQIDMSWDIFRKIIDEAQNYDVRTSYLHMIGEPLLHRLITHMIEYVHDAGIKTSISTNCVYLDDLTAKRLLRCGLDELVLCLDGTTKEVYDKYRVGGNFERVKRNIDECIAIRRKMPESSTQLVIQLIKMSDNESHIREVRQMYEEKLHGIGTLLFKEYSRFAGFVPDLGHLPTPSRRYRCAKTRTHFAIQSDGDCVICCRDFEKFTVVGNVMEATIHDMWHSEKYNMYRRQFELKDWNENPLCRDC